MTNAYIKHDSVYLDGVASTRIISVHQSSFKYDYINDVILVKIPTTKQKRSDGISNNRIVDLLRVEDTFELRGALITDETSRTTVNESLTDSDTTITVADSSKLENAGTDKPSFIQVGNEVIKYTGVSGNDLTGCVRGFGGTTAASHASGTAIYHPAFHFRKQLEYMKRSGGTCTLLYPGPDPTAENYIGSDSIDTTKADNFTVVIKQTSESEVSEDPHSLPDIIDVTINVVKGVDL